MPEHRLVLHVGTHKTGTTAVQAYMGQCRAPLAAQGILYPSLRPGRWREMDAHHKVAQALARHNLLDRVRLGRYARYLQEQRTTARLTVLSAESIFRHVLGKPGQDDLPAWFAAHRSYLRRLSQWLDGFEVRPLVYLREPSELAISMFKEHVVRRLLAPGQRDLGSFLAMSAHYYEYSSHVAALRDVFGTVDVRDYADAQRRGLQAEFARHIGAENLPAPAHDDVRRSPSNRATLWLAAQPRQRSRDHYRRVLFAVRTGNGGPFDEDEPTTLWPDATVFERFVERHGASWDQSFLPAPNWPGLRPAAWSRDDHAAADAAFADWQRRNLETLRKREARGLAFYAPDPG